MNIKYYGEYGGCFVPEILMPPLIEVERAMEEIMPTADFQNEFNDLLTNYAGRETPITFCPTLSKELGFNLWLKREDLVHTGAHKMNNTLGQALLAKRMGKTTLLAETGAGQHGVATAAAAARLGLKCVVFMGAEDVERQIMNVMRMRVFGAEVHAVDNGTRTLKDAINEALRYWIVNMETTHYCFGTAAGPHPFPELVATFQSVIGREARKQCLATFGALPDYVVACVGGGSNAIPGVLHGNRTVLLQTEDGQIEPSHSIAAGLDYPGVGPEHAYLRDTGRELVGMVRDANALSAFQRLSRAEGILPAMESSHALAWVFDHADELPKGGNILVNLSGRGDKDMTIIKKYLGRELGFDALTEEA